MDQRASIAVVDDDESVCRALTRLIRAAGMEAQAYTSAEAFHATLRCGLPDRLVLDVQMPGTNGLRLQEQLAQEGRFIPILFITARNDEAARACALERGAVGVLGKFFDDEVLLSAIEVALKRSKSGPQQDP